MSLHALPAFGGRLVLKVGRSFLSGNADAFSVSQTLLPTHDDPTVDR
jgi:hypothetical protein